MIAQPIYSPPVARIFHLDSPSTLRRRFCSASLSRLFQHRPAVAFTRFLHGIMHSVAFPFVSTSTVPWLPFLFSTSFPSFRLFNARFVCSTYHNGHTLFRHVFLISVPLPFPSSRHVLPISRLNPYSSTSTSTYSAVAHLELRWPGYDLIVRCCTML